MVGWFKLNTDGASHGNPGLAAAGGVVRDGEGNWCSSFALNIGICSAPLAELWGVYYGLYIAWERGITCLELEVDSEIVVGFLRTGIEDLHPLEDNRLADELANYAFSLPLGCHLFASNPESVNLLLLEDFNGSAHPKNVRL
ncbi:Ribonuclease H-like superfamily [Arabidopsis suecica]|uniref:Ribonuclease H-like superfamily n=1 Tax=Arabidopsis suecica TaxID=45249 RepID=A0A8T2BQ41_ARASU|nr:Ribonuclease H-like superfamily [Arabidopsis suecica]